LKAGQLLARLDDAELKQQVAVAEAALATAKATAARVRTDEARAQAVLQQARLQNKRLIKLVFAKLASQEELDKATETLHIAEADLNHSRSAIVEAHSQIVSAERNLQLRRVQLTFTKLHTVHTRVWLSVVIATQAESSSLAHQFCNSLIPKKSGSVHGSTKLR